MEAIKNSLTTYAFALTLIPNAKLLEESTIQILKSFLKK